MLTCLEVFFHFFWYSLIMEGLQLASLSGTILYIIRHNLSLHISYNLGDIFSLISLHSKKQYLRQNPFLRRRFSSVEGLLEPSLSIRDSPSPLGLLSCMLDAASPSH
ncbi:hypothetical protein AMTRI_Chr01g137010 [Amborella trichopoda]